MPNLSITWPDEPRVAPDESWAVWETMCGLYRIEYDGITDRYTPKYLALTRIKGQSRETIYEPTSKPGREYTHATFYAALDAINEYHCRRYGLDLISGVL